MVELREEHWDDDDEDQKWQKNAGTSQLANTFLLHSEMDRRCIGVALLDADG